jgi:ParB family chromosome partitioning protein
MFVRWISRNNKRGTFQFCYLCQTQRVEGKAKPENKTLAGLGSIALKPTKPEIAIFWMQVKVSLDKQDLSVADRAKIEAAIAQKVPKGKYQKFISAKSDEHNTPKYFLGAVVECMGGIDLDPTSNSRDNPNVPATKHLTIEDDALKHDWNGRVFLNPPFSQVSKFLKKLLAEVESGRVTEAIVLTKNDTRTKWYKQLRKNAQALCLAEGYHRFGDADNSATFGVLLTYFGDNPDRFREVFAKFGVCALLGIDELAANRQ